MLIVRSKTPGAKGPTQFIFFEEFLIEVLKIQYQKSQ